MKTFIAHFTCFAFLLQTLIIPLPAFADEEVATVQEGESAPFTGTLFSTEATARMLAEIELSRESCDIRIGEAVERKEAEMQLSLDQLQIRFDSNSEIFNQRLLIRNGQIDFLQQQLRPPSWYEHPALWISVGLIVGAGATIGVTYAVNTP
jgi:hypothetical protein